MVFWRWRECHLENILCSKLHQDKINKGIETKLLLQFMYLNLPYPIIIIYIFIYTLHLIKIAISISDVNLENCLYQLRNDTILTSYW